MADVTTFEQVESELAATADYDVAKDADKAMRRVAALRRKLDFAAASSEDGRNVEYQQHLAFVRANVAPTDQQRLNNPSVTHADFSTFGQYAGGASSNLGDVR